MGNAHGKANWTVIVQAGMCTRVAHGVSALLFLLNSALGGTGQTLVGWAWGFCTSMDGVDLRRLCVAPRSSVSSATTDGTVAPASDDCALVCARLLLHCVALRSSVSSASTDGAVAPALDDCALVCALRIGRLRACIGRLRARLRSAPSALNCDCCLRSSSMQLCLYMLSVRY